MLDGDIYPFLACVRAMEDSGIPLSEAEEFCRKIGGFPNLRLRGLMSVPPKCDNGEENIKYFCKMRKIFVDISAQNIDNSIIDTLSLGMSGDYAQAVDCGSTLVRIGSAIFGKRQ